jgi:hypothetical protein
MPAEKWQAMNLYSQTHDMNLQSMTAAPSAMQQLASKSCVTSCCCRTCGICTMTVSTECRNT